MERKGHRGRISDTVCVEGVKMKICTKGVIEVFSDSIILSKLNLEI